MAKADTKNYTWLRAAFFLLFLCADQLTKHFAAANLKGNSAFVVFKNVLSFSYWENTGAAFSSLQGMNTLLTAANILLLALLFVALLRIPKEDKWLPLQYALALLLCGGLGNLLDRILRGFVVDFIFFVPINFPKFNLADSYIVLAIIWLLCLVLFRYKEDEFFALFKTKRKSS